MTKAPERIWIHPTEKQPLPAKDKHLTKWIRGKWQDHDGTAYGDVEYVRADTIPALLAAEREKALREALTKVRLHDTGDMTREDMEARRIADRILTLIDTETEPQPDLSGTSEPQATTEVTVQQAAKFREINEPFTQEELQEVFGEVIPMHFVAILTAGSLGGPLAARRIINIALAGEDQT